MAGAGGASRDIERPFVQRLGLHKLSLGTGVFGGEVFLGFENDKKGVLVACVRCYVSCCHPLLVPAHASSVIMRLVS